MIRGLGGGITWAILAGVGMVSGSHIDATTPPATGIVTVHRQVTSVPASCGGTAIASCEVTAMLSVRRGGEDKGTATRKEKEKTEWITVGRASQIVLGARETPLPVALNSRGRALLRERKVHGMQVRYSVVSVEQAASASIVVMVYGGRVRSLYSQPLRIVRLETDGEAAGSIEQSGHTISVVPGEYEIQALGANGGGGSLSSAKVIAQAGRTQEVTLEINIE